MSSSCVPPKNCVIHDRDPSGHDDQSDTSSECGSLCSCTSSSMASLATVDRAPARNTTALVTPPSMPQPVPQTTGVDGDSGYFPVRVSQRTPSRRERSRCGGCQRSRVAAASLRHFLLTMSEFFPWLAGFVIIYYSYCWWGMGFGFSAFLFMIGAHAIIRLVKTRGVLSCVPYSSRQHVESDPSSESEDESEPEQQRGAPEVRVDWATEKPPSYDIAVVKPPPYDLQYHLTPQHDVSDLPVKLQHGASEEILIVPQRMVEEDNDTDLHLPSYQDAMMLSLHSDTDEQRRPDGES